MSKALKITVIGSCIFLAIGLIIVFSHVLDRYRIPSAGNSPVLEAEQIVYSTNLITPGRYDHVVYKRGDEFWTQQLVGLPGDKIAFVNGRLMVNDRDMDDSLSVKFAFIVSTMDYQLLVDAGAIIEEGMPISLSEVMLNIQPEVLKKYKIRHTPRISAKGVADLTMANVWKNTNWNADHFGPLVVPEGKIFVAGNNRQNSLDSRYIGFVNEADVVGVIFW